MPPHSRSDEAPPAFLRAVQSLHRTVRPEIVVEDIPARAPCPYTVAMAATVHTEWGRGVRTVDRAVRPGGVPRLAGAVPDGGLCERRTGTGLVRGPAARPGGLELADRGPGGWGAGHHTLSGTVTRATTEGFGLKAGEPKTTEVEVRASWTPTEAEDLSAHRAAWLDLLSVAAGLPPVDVTDISRRARSDA